MKIILSIAAGVALIGPMSARPVDVHLTVRQAADSAEPSTLDDARWLFYNARYEAAAALTLDPCASRADGVAACELRTAALLFQIRRAIGEAADKDKAWKN
jgi:hypothetical protein